MAGEVALGVEGAAAGTETGTTFDTLVATAILIYIFLITLICINDNTIVHSSE